MYHELGRLQGLWQDVSMESKRNYDGTLDINRWDKVIEKLNVEYDRIKSKK
jgi:hypothetical protein